MQRQHSVTLSGGRQGGAGPSSDPDGHGQRTPGRGRRGRRAFRVLGAPLPRARPARHPAAPQPRRPRPGLPATPPPPAGTSQAAARRPGSGGAGRAGGGAARATHSPWPESRQRAHSPESHGAGNARCPGDASWAPRPVPKVGSGACHWPTAST